jgi:hypothetical protein
MSARRSNSAEAVARWLPRLSAQPAAGTRYWRWSGLANGFMRAKRPHHSSSISQKALIFGEKWPFQIS